MKRTLFFLIAALITASASAYELKRVSVHDPSIVWEPTSSTYYIFGSHRAVAKTTDLMSWSTVNPVVRVGWSMILHSMPSRGRNVEAPAMISQEIFGHLMLSTTKP